ADAKGNSEELKGFEVWPTIRMARRRGDLMGKKKGSKGGTPRTQPLSWAEIEHLKKDNKELQLMLNSIAYRTVFTRDVLEESGKRLHKRGKMTPAIAQV
ncbi:unnamed protein product, partial [marine sediment metagenome]